MRHFILLALSSVFLLACDRPIEMQTITGAAQGTTYSVKYWSDKDADTAEERALLQQAVDAELARIDKQMSNYRDDSVIEQFNQQKVANQPLPLSKEILDVLNISAEVHEKSLGCYEPTIKPLFKIWGFKKDKLYIPTDEQIRTTLQSIGFKHLQRGSAAITKRIPEVTVDLSAIGQGYAVQQIAKLLEAKGITNYLAEIGGEMLVSGTKPKAEQWRVGVERPVPDSQKVNEVITVSGKRPVAIMTSGTYRHYFDENGVRYSHILDPRSGKPVAHDSVAVTVLLDNATYADAWSTALLCLGSEAGLAVANQHHIPAVFYDMKADEKLTRTESQSVQTEKAYWTATPQ